MWTEQLKIKIPYKKGGKGPPKKSAPAAPKIFLVVSRGGGGPAGPLPPPEYGRDIAILGNSVAAYSGPVA